MDRQQLRETLLDVFEQETWQRPENLADNVRIREGLKLDTADLLIVTMRVEARLGFRRIETQLEFSRDFRDFEKINTVGELLDVIQAKLAARLQDKVPETRKSNRTTASVPALDIGAMGTARLDLPAIAMLRKSLPPWVPADTPGNFLKHADEQTVAAVTAIDHAIQSQRMSVADHKDWSIIAAPRFVGRLAAGTTIDRFSRGGGPTISPHLISKHSLHSISGTLSILLANRSPNLGVGGGANSLTEGLLASLTFPSLAESGGVWLVCTAWNPEPECDLQASCTNAPICHAVALALRKAGTAQSCGRLKLIVNDNEVQSSAGSRLMPSATVAEFSETLSTAAYTGQAGCCRWKLPWGATLAVDIHAAAGQRLAAA